MDEAAIEAIKKAVAAIDQELSQYEDFFVRYDVLRKSRAELREILASSVPPAEVQATENAGAGQLLDGNDSASKIER